MPFDASFESQHKTKRYKGQLDVSRVGCPMGWSDVIGLLVTQLWVRRYRLFHWTSLFVDGRLLKGEKTEKMKLRCFGRAMQQRVLAVWVESSLDWLCVAKLYSIS